MDSSLILKNLVSVPCVSGFEHVFSSPLLSLVPKARKDRAGNIVARYGKGRFRVLIEAHFDEVGFLKTPAGAVTVGDIEEKEIKNVVYEASGLGYFKRTWRQKGTVVESPALDNKVGCAVLVQLTHLLAKSKLSSTEIMVAFTAEEETTGRGIMHVVESYKPHLIISVDAAYSRPYPGAARWHLPECGKGPSFQTMGAGFFSKQESFVQNVAKQNNISLQPELTDSSAGPTNVSYVYKHLPPHVSVFQLNVPVKNQHTACSITDVRDIDTLTKLLFALLSELNNRSPAIKKIFSGSCC